MIPYELKWAAGCMELDNMLAIYNNKEHIYTKEEIKSYINTKGQVNNYNYIVDFTRTMITMINVFSTYTAYSSYLNYTIIALIEIISNYEDNGMEKKPSAILKWPYSVTVEQMERIYSDVLTYKFFLKAIKDVYSLQEIDDLIEKVENQAREYKRDLELLKNLLDQCEIYNLIDKAPEINADRTVTKQVYNAFKEEIKDPDILTLSYFTITRPLYENINSAAPGDAKNDW